MSKPRIMLTNPLWPSWQRQLEAEAEVVVAPDGAPETLRQLAATADALIVRSPLPDDIFDSAPRAVACVRNGAGLDRIPVERATALGIPVANAPGGNAHSVAEFCLALMLSLARRLAPIARELHATGWHEARTLLAGNRELTGKTLGILGVGAIGSRLAQICHHGLGMRVLGCQRRLDRLPPFVAPATLTQVFSESDFVVVACPLTEATRGLVSRELIARMKNTAFLVNVARGPVVDEPALIEALAQRRIAGAGLDVFWKQPLPRDHPFLTLDNVLLTPHVAGTTDDSRERISAVVVEELRRMLRGEKPVNFVNPECWPRAQARRAALGHR